jgi:hypothetical protein
MPDLVNSEPIAVRLHKIWDICVHLRQAEIVICCSRGCDAIG